MRVALIKLDQRCITGQGILAIPWPRDPGNPQCSELCKQRTAGRRSGLPLMHQWNQASCKDGSQVQLGVWHMTQQQVMQQDYQLVYQMNVQR